MSAIPSHCATAGQIHQSAAIAFMLSPYFFYQGSETPLS